MRKLFSIKRSASAGIAIALAIQVMTSSWAYALPSVSTSSQEYTKRFNYYSAIYNCIRGLSSGDKKYYSIQFEAKGDGENIDGLISKPGSGDWAGVGYIGSDNGQLKCAESAQAAISNLGISAKELIEALGYTLQSINGKSTWVSPRDANGNYLSNNFDSHQKMAANFKAWAEKNNIPTSEPSHAYYYNTKAALEADKGCKALSIGAYSTVSIVVQQKADQKEDNYRKVKIVSGSTATDFVYVVEKISNKDVNAYPRPENKDGGASRTSCNQIVDSISSATTRFLSSSNEQAYDNAINSYIEALATKFCNSSGTGSTIDEYNNNCKSKIRAAVNKCSEQDRIGSSSRPSKIKRVDNIDIEFISMCISKELGGDHNPADISAILTSTKLEVEPECTDGQVTSEDGKTCEDPKEDRTSCVIEGVGWIVCPAMLFMANMLGGAFNYISDAFLQLEPAMVEGARSTWQVFLNIANVVLIIIFLIIIFSQISGIGVSNYGIKKLLPKIFIVAILMNLSFLICQLLVDASNIVGRAVYDTMAVDILSATAGEAAASSGSTISSSINAGQMTALVLAGGAGGAAAIYFLLPVLGATLLAGLVSIITVVFILVARKALIVLLIVVAPLAFAAMLLPNTEKLFDKWKKLMMSLLLLFPIIGLIFGASNLAAGIVQVSGQDILNQIVSLMIMSIPLFAVVPVLKGALNGLGQIGAKINGMSGKLQASAQKRGEDSRLGQYGKYVASKRAKDKALVQAGSYKGSKRNFIRRGMSGINRKINQNEAFNRATGNFGLRSAAAGVSGVTSEENKQVEDQMLLINNGVDEREKIDNAARVLTEANSSGDVIRARAAQKILLSSGAPGIQKVHDTIHQLETSKSLNQNVSSALRSDIASSGLKGKDNALSSWAYAVDINGKAITMRQSEQSASTYSGLNAVEMAGQNIEDLREGANVGGITAAHAQAVLSNDDAQAILGQEKRDFFASIANGQPAPDQGKARKRDSQTTTTAPQAPRRAAPPNPSTPGAPPTTPGTPPSTGGSNGTP